MFRPHTSSIRYLAILFACACLMTAGCARERTDSDRLKSEWKAQTVVVDDSPHVNSEMSSMSMIFNEGYVTFKVQGTEHTGYWWVEEKENPPRLRIMPMSGDAKHQPLYGIYRFLSQDLLQVCFSESGYPKKLKASAGSGCLLITFQRVR